nr:unnamed protein product [Spirometra erinaceieuropaei]
MNIPSQEDISRSARPIGWRGSRTDQKLQSDFDEPPTPCFAKHKRVRFVEKPETQQYSCRSSPLEERRGLSNSKWPGNQESRRWEYPQFTLSLLGSPIHSKAYTTCLPYVCFKRKPTANEKAIWRCGKNLREKISTRGRGTTIRNSNFTKVLSGLVEHLRSERSLMLRLKRDSGRLGTRTVVQDESESKRDFPKREVKATNNYDLNLVFALAHNQMDSVYITDSQPDEGFVDSPELLGGYIYPDSLMMGEWEGYEKPSQFWTDSEDDESNLYEPVRGLPVFPKHLRPTRLAPLNCPEDYYGDTSGCESGNISPLEPSVTRDLLKQTAIVQSPLDLPLRQNAHRAQPFMRALEACPNQPTVTSHVVSDSSSAVYQTTPCSSLQGECQRKPNVENRILGSLARLSLPDWAKRFLGRNTHSGIERGGNGNGSHEDQKALPSTIPTSHGDSDVFISFTYRKPYLPRFPRFLPGSECIEFESCDEQHIYYERIAGNPF